MQKPDFIICAPIFSVARSNGVLALVEMGRAIQKLGRSVYFCVNSQRGDQEVIIDYDFDNVTTNDERGREFVESIRQARDRFGIQLLTDFSQKRIDESYVIYPEVMLYNVLNAKRTVRYFLNKDGNLRNGRKVNAGPNDFILAHSKTMHPNPHHVCFFSQQNPVFHDENTHPAKDRKLDITYLGKGENYGLTGTMPNTITITRTWPQTKEELALLLRNCRMFITGDACSNLNVEALSCGAVPVFLHNGPWTDAEIDGTELGTLPRVHTGTTMGENFFDTFEVERKAFLARVRRLEEGWEQGVATFVEKVDAHFAERAPFAAPQFAAPVPFGDPILAG